MTQLSDLDQFAATLDTPVVKHEFLAVLHKLRYPMKDILQKVKGDSLAERARAVGVSRQTVYVWLDERFRPVGPQAKKLAKLTGVPVEHIKEYQNDAGRTVAKKAQKLASRRKAASSGDGRAKRQRGRVVVPSDRGGSVRARGKRTSG
jgi:DNA-binding XRE family transcriptional regulator